MEAHTRDDYLYMAKLAESAQRYEDMGVAMSKAISINPVLSKQERLMFSTAYKSIVGPRKTAWRTLKTMEDKLIQSNSKVVNMINIYKAKIEGELNRYCNQLLSLLDSLIFPSVTEIEDEIFYLKMKGDYYRYMAEYSIGPQLKKIEDSAESSYTEATEKAEQYLKPVNSTRVALALNYSVFLFEIKKDRTKAIGISKKAFDLAIYELDNLEQDQYAQTTPILQLLRDGITIWVYENEEKQE